MAAEEGEQTRRGDVHSSESSSNSAFGGRERQAQQRLQQQQQKPAFTTARARSPAVLRSRSSSSRALCVCLSVTTVAEHSPEDGRYEWLSAPLAGGKRAGLANRPDAARATVGVTSPVREKVRRSRSQHNTAFNYHLPHTHLPSPLLTPYHAKDAPQTNTTLTARPRRCQLLLSRRTRSDTASTISNSSPAPPVAVASLHQHTAALCRLVWTLQPALSLTEQ